MRHPLPKDNGKLRLCYKSLAWHKPREVVNIPTVFLDGAVLVGGEFLRCRESRIKFCWRNATGSPKEHRLEKCVIPGSNRIITQAYPTPVLVNDLPENPPAPLCDLRRELFTRITV